MTVFVPASTRQRHVLLEWRRGASLQFVATPWLPAPGQGHLPGMPTPLPFFTGIWSWQFQNILWSVCDAFLEINHVSCLGDSRQDHLFNVLLCHHLLHIFHLFLCIIFRLFLCVLLGGRSEESLLHQLLVYNFHFFFEQINQVMKYIFILNLSLCCCCWVFLVVLVFFRGWWSGGRGLVWTK